MNILLRFLRKINKMYINYYKNKSEFKKMDKIDDNLLNLVKQALVSVISREQSQDELIWIEKIENLRHRLRNSSKEIEVINYGARTSKSQLSAEEMYKGRISTETVGKVCLASVPYEWGLLMFKIIRSFKPEVCIELGTCLGLSSSYIASALEINKKGHVITIEGSPSYAKIAKENFLNLGLARVDVKVGRFQDVLEEILNGVEEVNYVFIDGHHDEKATINYYSKFVPFLNEKAILIFDDIRWSKGMERAWKTIINHKNINYSIDLFKLGICIVSPSIKPKKNFKYYLN